jgi:hypothetical protein
LLVSSHIASPMSLGFLTPAILIPQALLDTLSDSELEHVVLHELGHLRRRDDWTNFAQKLIEAILPIQPAVYWIGHRMSIEREMACDDWVVATTGTAKPYAASLTKVAELSMGARGRAGSRRDRKTFATFQPRPSHAGQNSERGSEACPRPAGDGDCRSRDIDLRGRAGAANDRLRAESGVRK